MYKYITFSIFQPAGSDTLMQRWIKLDMDQRINRYTDILETDGCNSRYIWGYDGFLDTMVEIWIQWQICGYNGRFVNTMEDLWIQQQICEYNGRFVDTMVDLW